MFVWVFHRISGILLIFLLIFQLSTGFFQASSSNSELVRTVALLHRHAVSLYLLVFLLIFHVLYGVRTMLMDLGLQRERLSFWVCTILGLILFAVFIVLYSTWIAA